MKIQREHWFAAGATKVACKTSSAVVYFWTSEAGVVRACGFTGRKQKPTFNFVFIPRHNEQITSEEKRSRYVTKFFADTIAGEAARKECKDMARNRRNGDGSGHDDISVGDVFSASWGYDQTNVNFYQVVGKSGATMLILREVHANSTDAGNCSSGECTARLNEFKGDKLLRKKYNAGSKSVRINSVQYASLWDGTPQYCSSGH